MEAIKVLEKTGKDGALNLRIPIGKPDVECEVVVIIQPKTANAWPPGYFDLAGSIPDESFVRHPVIGIDPLTGLPVIECKQAAAPEVKPTHERVANILLTQEAGWLDEAVNGKVPKSE